MSEPADWFAEPPRRGWQQRVAVIDRLFDGRSPYQHVEILDTIPFGRMLVLDDAVQTTLADEYIYHEMLVHLPLVHHGSVRKVLIVGGGDGGALRRVLEHPVERAVMVEIDGLVVESSLEHLAPIAGSAFQDPRAELIIGDGAGFVRETSERFDAILVDSTDPVGAAGVLVERGFFRDARRALAPGGLFVMQSGSPLLMPDELVDAAARLGEVFGQTRTYLASIPSYPAVLWSFTMAVESGEVSMPSQDEVSRRVAAAGLRCGYYNAEAHLGAFGLPSFVANILAGVPSEYDHPLPGR